MWICSSDPCAVTTLLIASVWTLCVHCCDVTHILQLSYNVDMVSLSQEAKIVFHGIGPLTLMMLGSCLQSCRDRGQRLQQLGSPGEQACQFWDAAAPRAWRRGKKRLRGRKKSERSRKRETRRCCVYRLTARSRPGSCRLCRLSWRGARWAWTLLPSAPNTFAWRYYQCTQSYSQCATTHPNVPPPQPAIQHIQGHVPAGVRTEHADCWLSKEVFSNKTRERKDSRSPFKA